MKNICLFILLSSHLIFSQTKIIWQHFDTATFEKAKKEKKHIILHLAANWCHWCHVMEEKTYQHPDIVKYINQNFIATTEDHDQRPDLANKYRDYGWPATIIFSPDGKEIFKEAGYIQPEEYLQILKKIKSGKISTTSKHSTSTQNTNNITINPKNLLLIKKDVFENINLKNGGFKSEQKSLDFEMFEYAFNHFENDTLKQWLTLSMKNSLYLMDKEWGGIYQYSTSNDWQHPHYEKLLSIQARYIKMYLWYFYLSNDSTYFHSAIKIYNYLNIFLKKNNHSFSNAQDADLIKGQKANDYFSLSDHARRKLGIPTIDTNTFTDNNSKIIESLIYLYAFTEKKQYLDHAISIAEYILNHRKRPDHFFNHGYTNDLTPAIVDQIYFAKALFLLYRTIGNQTYLNTAQSLLHLISEKFFNANCLMSYLPVPHYLSPDCIISENIEAARTLNLYGKIFHQEKWIQLAKKISDYLLSDEVYNKIIIEPGILTLLDEINSEPYFALYIVHNISQKNYALHRQLLQIPKFYLFNYLMTEYNVLKEKEDIFNAFNENTIVFCTSSYCSSPISNAQELSQFIRKQLFKK